MTEQSAPPSTPDGLTPWSQPRSDFWFGLATALAAFVLYALTVQRTVSFWDCGEFIACAVSLGIPHPPGAPLFVAIGRVLALLPTATDVGLRVNLISVISGALAVGLGYLLLARVLRRWVLAGPDFWGRDWLVFMASQVGAGMMGFSATVWANAVEAEVYGITLFMFLIIVYSTLVWIDRRESSSGPRLLLFVSFVAALGMGAHMMVFLAVPAFWLTVFLLHKPYRSSPVIWSGAVGTLMVTFTGVEAYLFALSFLIGLGILRSGLVRVTRARHFSWIALVWLVLLYFLFQVALPLREPLFGTESAGNAFGDWVASFHWGGFDWLATMLVVAGAWFAAVRYARGATPLQSVHWKIGTGVVACALVAFTLHLYIPIRSCHDPAIDENNPESWVAFKGFLERKQYGRESMVTRMFHRRGEWKNQLGRHPRMGFWSFFEKQYGIKSGPLDVANPERSGYLPPAFILLFLLGLFGVGYLAAVYWQAGLPLLLTLLLTTVGLVGYMNFADGTHYNPRVTDQAYLEVRDRDYFFSTGFALFGLFIGLGVGGFMRLFRDPRKRRLWAPVVVVSSAVFLFALPGKTIMANYWPSDRSRDFIPYDYAYNMLASCDRNSILFTNGDNDTFPIWCLQEAYGIRTDVKLINLSLSNTHWYIHQIKNRMGVAFDLPDDQIDRLVPSAQRGRIQDQVIDIVLLSNRWQRPVHFGASVPEGSRVFQGATLDSNLQIVGMTLKLTRERAPLDVDRALTMKRYRDDFRFRGVNDATIFKTEATRRIADNYATGLLFVADSYRREGLLDSAVAVVNFAIQLRPELLQARAYLAQMAGEYGREGLLDTLLAKTPAQMQAELYYNYGLAAELRGLAVGARPAYRQALALDARHVQAFRRLASGLYDSGAFDSLLGLIDAWIAANPEDTTGPLLRADIVSLLNSRETGPASGQP